MSEGGSAHPLPLARFSVQPRSFPVNFDEVACAQLAARFGLVAIQHLHAELEAWRADGGVKVEGRFNAEVVQACAVSNAPIPARIEQKIAVQYLPAKAPLADEIELEAGDLEVLPLGPEGVDLGELVAESLYLALDPYPLAAGEVVEEARQRLLKGKSPRDDESTASVSPFAKLKKL